PGGDPGIRIGIGPRKAGAVAPVGKTRQHHLAGTRPSCRQLIEARPAHSETAQPQERVAPPRSVIDAVAHRLPVFAVARHVDAEIALAAHDLADLGPQLLLDAAVVIDLTRLTSPIGLDQRIRARQAAGMT